MKTRKSNKVQRAFAFTVLELMVVIGVSVVALFLFLLLQPGVHKPQNAVRIQCVNNLKQVGVAFRVWTEENDIYPMRYRTNDFDGPSFANGKQMFIYFQVMSNDFPSPKTLICPADKKREAATNFVTDFNSGHVSYFVGVNAERDEPNGLLGGDRNLTSGVPPKGGVLEIATNQVTMTNYAIAWTDQMHRKAGNVLFADGHSEQLTSSKLREALMRSGMATNRLVLPP